MSPTPASCFCSVPWLTGKGVSPGFPGSIRQLRGSFCCLCSLDLAQPALEELFGGAQRAIFGNLLLRAAPPREPVQVLQLAEALGHTLGREPGFWVVVPALGQSLTHHLDALQRERSPQAT